MCNEHSLWHVLLRCRWQQERRRSYSSMIIPHFSPQAYNIWIMHGVAGNSKKYWPMWRHCSPRVKTEYVLLPEAKPRAIMLMRSSPEGYSDVTEVNIFYYWPATTCIIHFITWPASLPAYTKFILFPYFLWLLSQVFHFITSNAFSSQIRLFGLGRHYCTFNAVSMHSSATILHIS